MSHAFSRTKDWTFVVVGVVKVTDGDTFWLRLDVGFRQVQLTHLRLADYDTPEVYGRKSDFELFKARQATAFVAEWLDWHLDSADVYVMATTRKDPDSFGRWLATLTAYDLASGRRLSSLGEQLREAELASIWPTRWREEFDT